MTGLDLLHVRDGKLVHNDAFTDGLGLARQLGLMPPQGSRTDTAMLGAFNAKTRGARRLAGTSAEPVADGVWRVQGNPGRLQRLLPSSTRPAACVQFNTGARTMGDSTRFGRRRCRQLGGLAREVVLGHGHADHRGTAPRLGVPVRCHTDATTDAEGSGGWSYWGDLGGLISPSASCT